MPQNAETWRGVPAGRPGGTGRAAQVASMRPRQVLVPAQIPSPCVSPIRPRRPESGRVTLRV